MPGGGTEGAGPPPPPRPRSRRARLTSAPAPALCQPQTARRAHTGCARGSAPTSGSRSVLSPPLSLKKAAVLPRRSPAPPAASLVSGSSARRRRLLPSGHEGARRGPSRTPGAAARPAPSAARAQPGCSALSHCPSSVPFTGLSPSPAPRGRCPRDAGLALPPLTPHPLPPNARDPVGLPVGPAVLSSFRVVPL